MIPDVSKTSIDKILVHHLGYSKVCARWVPRQLTADHKRQRIEAAREFLQAYETDDEEFLDSIVNGDETWVHYTTPETKQQRGGGRRGFKLPTRLGGRVLRHRHTEDGSPYAKMHRPQRRLCREVGKSLSFQKKYYSMQIKHVFIVKKNWEPYFMDNLRN